MAFFTSGFLGGDPDVIAGTGTSTAGAGAPHRLGQIESASDGNTYMFVQAAEALTRYSALFITATHQASMITKAVAAADTGRLGFNQVAFAQYDFGWVIIHGSSFRIRFADSCAKNVQLYTTDTAGVLDDLTVSTSQYLIAGLSFYTVSGNTASAGLANGAFPQIRKTLTAAS
jgi:hypothetical protein